MVNDAGRGVRFADEDIELEDRPHIGCFRRNWGPVDVEGPLIFDRCASVQIGGTQLVGIGDEGFSAGVFKSLGLTLDVRFPCGVYGATPVCCGASGLFEPFYFAEVE